MEWGLGRVGLGFYKPGSMRLEVRISDLRF